MYLWQDGTILGSTRPEDPREWEDPEEETPSSLEMRRGRQARTETSSDVLLELIFETQSEHSRQREQYMLRPSRV